MSRRKQAKPQHLTSDMDGLEVKDTSENGSENVLLRQVDKEDSGAETHSGAEETHVCEKCCAEFFTWSDLFEHQSGCSDNAPVLILKENEGISSQGSPTGSSSAVSLHSHLADVDIRGIDRECVEMAEEPLEVSEKNHKDKIDEPMDTGLSMDQVSLVCPLPKEVEETSILFPSVLPGYGIPSTNVTLEILQSTRVAVAQFSQCVGGEGIGGRVNAAAIPVIMEQLMALQQQQVHQLQLIEQIQSQVAVMNRQPTQAALNPASKGLYAPPSPFQLQGGGISPPVLPVSGVIPSAAHGQASLSVASTLERPPSRSSQQDGEPPKPRQKDGTSASLANPSLPLSSCSTASPLLPPYCCSLAGVSSTQTPSSHNLLPLGQASLFGQSANLPLLPQSPTSGVIFPNPLASIAATASALDPLSALIKHRKSKMPSISMFDGKSSCEDPFFKHKCRFCAKVFGSDSALQIHLRSHTGERPFKCNICGNRFSTKGNLKVHFQRHKDKYPHVQMNPYQVPEYLDNIPTSSGIPYGMSFPPEKPGTAWTESKPVLPTVPTSVSLQLPPALTCMERLCESYSKTPSGRSPQRPSPARSECASLSPDFVGTEPSKSAVLAPHQSKTEMEVSPVLATEEINLPSNCMTKAGESLASVKHHMPSDSKAKGSLQTEKTPDYINIPVSVSNSSPPSPLLSDQSRDKFPFGGTLESMHTSETSKLQQLVENIDKNMMDPNQCVICHRVLSCQSALKMHYRIHTGERPFKCKVCGRAFTTKGNLKTHFGVHRAKPPLRVLHSCPICQRKFTNAVVLQQHIRMHMGGQIPNSAQTEVFQNKDSEIAFDEKSFDGMSNYDDDGLDDNSVGEEEANEGTGTSTPNSVSDVLPSSSGLLDSSSLTSSESQISAGDSTIDCSYALKSMRNEFMDSDYLTNDSSSIRDLDTHCVRSPAMSKLSMSGHSPLAPSYSFPLDRLSAGPNLHPKSHLEITASVKSEQSDSSAPYAENGLSSNQMGLQSLKSFVKTEISNSKMSGIKRPSDVDSSMTQSMVKMEMNGYGRPNTINDRPNSPFGFQSPTSPSEMIIPGIASLLGPPPPRRTPKQHNCNACGKNFSSASALQIHERTHTGEKPFGCSVCGRAFTTKGNLKVHMGTHMWNNTPARRGRRLSVENPLTLFGGEAVKFNEMFQNDLATRAMNVDPSFWSRYVAAITNGLAMKNNEISVIQNGGVHPSSAMTMVMDKTGTGNSPQMTTHAKTNTDIGIGQHFSMLTGDSKEIGIN